MILRAIIIAMLATVCRADTVLDALASVKRTPAIAAGLVQYHCFDGTAWDCFAEVLGTHITTNSQIVGGGYRQEFCLSVNGASSDNNRFDTAVSNAVDGAPGYTVAMWVKPVATNVANQCFFGNAYASSRFIGTWMESNGRLVSSYQNDGIGLLKRSRTDIPPLVAGVWSYLLITARTNELPQCYVDGILIPSSQVNNAGTLTNGMQQIRVFSIGRAPSAGLSGGQISYQNFTVYNRKFESNEVWQLYAGWEYPP